MFHKTPDYSFLRIFGCVCFPLLRPCNIHKHQYTSQECVFLGYSYSHKGYKCLASDGRIYISKDVLCNESKFPYPTLFSSKPNPIIADQSNPTPLTVLPTIPASSVVSQPYPYPLLLYNSSNLLIIPHLNLAFLLLPQLLLFHSCIPLHLHSL